MKIVFIFIIIFKIIMFVVWFAFSLLMNSGEPDVA